MLLPHGWEGQGPEHSSARLERYLQLCAQENMQVVAPTTAAQMFHLLRRQMKRKLRIPLIVMSPKSMLRRKESFSKLGELCRGHFYNLIPEHEELDPKKVTRVIACSGKVYYELLARRTEEKITNVAIVRVEQIYPFPIEELKKEIAKYPNAREIVWTQEEPRNQGPWYQIRHNIVAATDDAFHNIQYAGREACSAPAGGNPARHRERERKLIEEALGLRPLEKMASKTKKKSKTKK
jgi:2-oxoglutarate dehydrogenase E1 component